MTSPDMPMYVRADDVEFLEDFLSELADQLQLDAEPKDDRRTGVEFSRTELSAGRDRA